MKTETEEISHKGFNEEYNSDRSSLNMLSKLRGRVRSQQIALWILNVRIISIRAIIKWLQCAKGRGTLDKYFPGLLDCGRDDPLGPD
ncbi:hypothetical protein E4U45_005466 [Claviceps purpurea]|nr:hypothetical protein E4U45_005466 [Claviceps purpurea]